MPAPKPQQPPRPRSSTPSQFASEAEDFVGQILEAVTGGQEVDLDPEALRGRMESAAEEFDRRTATAFCDALLDQLSDDPANVRLLEALVIVGIVLFLFLMDTRTTLISLVAIPMSGTVESLNVSVAAGICLYEARRQRQAADRQS